MRIWILLCLAFVGLCSGRKVEFVPHEKIEETFLTDLSKRETTNAKTELWKNVAQFIDRYSPLKNGNNLIPGQRMKGDFDKLLVRMGPLPFPWGRLGLRPTLMK
jgi:hypothetical protein